MNKKFLIFMLLLLKFSIVEAQYKVENIQECGENNPYSELRVEKLNFEYAKKVKYYLDEAIDAYRQEDMETSAYHFDKAFEYYYAMCPKHQQKFEGMEDNYTVYVLAKRKSNASFEDCIKIINEAIKRGYDSPNILKLKKVIETEKNGG